MKACFAALLFAAALGADISPLYAQDAENPEALKEHIEQSEEGFAETLETTGRRIEEKVKDAAEAEVKRDIDSANQAMSRVTPTPTPMRIAGDDSLESIEKEVDQFEAIK